MSDVPHPLGLIDVSANGFRACIAPAGRQHIGDFAPHERPRSAVEPRHREWAARQGARCLFCQVAEPQGSEEHVLSVAMGNWFWVLPPDVVCGGCNHGVLSRLDTALLSHPLIAAVRVMANVPGRSGQPPQFAASNLKARRDRQGALMVETNHERHAEKTAEELRLRPKWTGHGPRKRRQTARALLKFAMGLTWLSHGPDQTDLPKYDHVRRAVLGDSSVPLQHGFENTDLPSHAVQGMVVTHDDHPALRVTLDYLGVQLWAATEGSADQASQEFLAQAV